MSSYKFYAAVGALFVGLGLAARWTAAVTHWSFKLTLLGFMLAALAAMSAFGWWQERKLARKLAKLPARERAALQALSVEARMVSSSASRKSAFFTVSVGVCLVNLPTLPLLLAPLLALQTWLSLEPPLPHLLALTIGFVLAWLWWSLMVTWWRQWAGSRGMGQEEVQYRGQGASILWPPGHLFERTEWANIWRPRSPRKDDA
jgi:prepilin signal peptidase PulO-like enzyme (type II secretory pathway)